MSQQSLNVSEAGSVSKEMGSAGVSENVGSDSRFERGPLGVKMEIFADGPAVHSLAPNRNPESPQPRLGIVRSACLEVSLDGPLGLRSKRHKAVFVPLP